MSNLDTLIIPDIHHKTDVVDAILAHHPEIERRVFLGDIYDDFGDSPKIMRRTAMWHKEMLRDRERNVFLLGNHDVTYMSGGWLTCAGYSEAKQRAFDKVMSYSDWCVCLFSYEVNGWLLSHAGYHPSLYSQSRTERTIRERRAVGYVEAHKYGDRPALLEAGRARGGRAGVGGVTWLDWEREFAPIPGVKQIVGHTSGSVPRSKGDNVCLDCHLAWYGVIRRNGTLELHETDGDMVIDSTEPATGPTLADVFQGWA